LIAEAIQQGYSLQNINVISLGTGKYVPNDAGNDMNMQPEYDKTLFWKDRSYPNSIMQESEKIDQRVRDLLPEENYVRFQPTLPEDISNLRYDSCEYDDYYNLADIAGKYLEKNPEMITKALKLLI